MNTYNLYLNYFSFNTCYVYVHTGRQQGDVNIVSLITDLQDYFELFRNYKQTSHMP